MLKEGVNKEGGLELSMGRSGGRGATGRKKLQGGDKKKRSLVRRKNREMEGVGAFLKGDGVVGKKKEGGFGEKKHQEESAVPSGKRHLVLASSSGLSM